MDFVYICRAGENEELRYSIRSVNYHYPEAIIWVVGEFPDWYDGDYIKVKQTATKYRNVLNNLKAIVHSPQIPENFILMNDDFYIIDKPKKLEYLQEGLLVEKYHMYYDHYQSSSYTRKLLETNSRLRRLGYSEAMSYELHVPFPVEKSKLARVLKYEDLLWRSMYGNIFEVNGQKSLDVKVYNEVKMNFKNYNYKDPHLPFLSTDDTSFKMIKKEILSKKFSKKTKYEKWVMPKTKG
jgi:hypothetical protein